jgi:hypothetical protein
VDGLKKDKDDDDDEDEELAGRWGTSSSYVLVLGLL